MREGKQRGEGAERKKKKEERERERGGRETEELPAEERNFRLLGGHCHE